MNEKKSVRNFKRKYKIKNISSESLGGILNKQGFTLIKFNGAADDEDVKMLVSGLDLQDYISTSRCFTYQDDKYRLVFVNENLNEEEMTIVLAHEEGHIWHKHFNSKNVLGNDIVQEYQANEFCHFLLEDKNGKKKKTQIFFSLLIILLIVVYVFCFIHKQKYEKAIYTDNLYITDNGTKYHLEDCMYIRDKTDVKRLTKDEFDSGEYEPCSACMPNKR